MMGDSSLPSSSDTSALATSGQESQMTAAKAYIDNRGKKTRPYCDHCRRPGHTK